MIITAGYCDRNCGPSLRFGTPSKGEARRETMLHRILPVFINIEYEGGKMKKVKIAYWVTIFVLLLLLFVQNQEFFMQKVSLSWNIISIAALANLEWKWFLDYKIPEVSMIIYFFAYFLAGVALTFIYCFFGQIKHRRTISFLNRTCKSHLAKISSLENELDTLKGGSGKSEKATIDISKKSTDADKKLAKKK